MRRTLTILGIFLAGAAVNILLAFAAAAWSELEIFNGESQRPARAEDRPGYLASFWPRPIRVTVMRHPGIAVTDTEVLCADVDPATLNASKFKHSEGPLRASVQRFSFGWPLRSMYWDTFGVQGGLDKQSTFEFLNRSEQAAGVRARYAFPKWVPGVSGSFRSIPRAVLPVGFVVNTAVFGTLLAAAFFGPGAVRRWRRRRRGLCPGCGYNIADLPAVACPECGRRSSRSPISPPAAAPAHTEHPATS